MTADLGTVRAPADPAGQYRYRILVARGSTTVTTSAASDLTVTGPSEVVGSGSAGCSSCHLLVQVGILTHAQTFITDVGDILGPFAFVMLVDWLWGGCATSATRPPASVRPPGSASTGRPGRSSASSPGWYSALHHQSPDQRVKGQRGAWASVPSPSP